MNKICLQVYLEKEKQMKIKPTKSYNLEGSCRNKQLYFEAVFWITDLLMEAAKWRLFIFSQI